MPGPTIEDTKYSLWDFKKYKEYEWFRFVVVLLCILGLLYIVFHIFFVSEEAGYEYQRLDKEQLQQINRIYFDSVNKLEAGLSVQSVSADSAASGDTTGNHADTVAHASDTSSIETGDVIMRFKSRRVIDYIQNQFSNKVHPVQVDQIRSYLYSALPLEAIGFLGTLRLKVQSYFWLVGPEVYFEIIFWSLFGVLSSILFNLGVVARERTTDPNNPNSVFDSTEIPFQVAKFFYAPLCTLAIVLGYNFFTEQNIVDISSSKGVIVFAFLGGFYSSRLIAFLDRLKEVILPISGMAELPVQKQPGVTTIKNITIELQLDTASVPPELVNDIVEIGLGDATVLLINDENGEQVKAVRTGEDQSSAFTVASIKPGAYTIKAAWSKEVNEQAVNLEGEQKTGIKNPDMVIAVLMKKAQEEG